MKCWNSDCHNEAEPGIDFCEACAEEFNAVAEKFFGGVDQLLTDLDHLISNMNDSEYE